MKTKPCFIIGASALFLAASCVNDPTSPPERPAIEETPAPSDVRASTDEPDHITLRWNVPDGAEPIGFEIHREGSLLVSLPADARSHDDDTTAAGQVQMVAELEAIPEVEAVQLRWEEAAAHPGTAHEYSVVALYLEGSSEPSAVVQGHRAAPSVTAYRLLRDGEPIAEVGAEARRYEDETTEPGWIEALAELHAEPGPDSVSLRWDGPASHPGSEHDYRVVAIHSQGSTVASRAARGFRRAPLVTGYRLSRDGEPLADLPAHQTLYEDREAAPWTIEGPSDLHATQGLSAEGVHLSWSPARSVPSKEHLYVVEALTELGASGSASASGYRDLPEAEIRYELRRDGGPWNDVGGQSDYWDSEAPFGTIEAIAEVIPDRILPVVELAFLDVAELIDPGPSLYELRVVGPATNEPPIAAMGHRSAGSDLRVQWQRKLADSELEYRDLEGATATSSLDFDVHGELFSYRAVLETTGARGLSTEAEGAVNLFADLAVGVTHICGIRASDRKMLCLGSNLEKKAPPTPTEESYRSVVAGSSHTCGIREPDGKVLCWGLGEMHAGPSADSFHGMSSGDDHVCAIRERDDRIICWERTLPFHLPPGIPVNTYVHVSAGAEHSCGIRKDDQKVDCWGENKSGQAPRGPSATSFSKLGAGTSHSCGIRSEDQRVECWGSNAQGQAPPGPSIETYVDLAANQGNTCAIRASDGKLDCWGTAPAGGFPAGEPFQHISMRARRGCGITREGKVSCWGSDVPRLPPNERFRSLSIYMNATCAVRERDGGIQCFPSTYLEKVGGRFRSVSIREHAACGIHEDDGWMECWGSDSNSRVSAAPAGSFREVAVGNEFVCAIGMDDRISCWGIGVDQLIIPDGPFRTIVAGNTRFCGIRADEDKLHCWLKYGHGRPFDEDDHSAVAHGNNHFCVIRKEDGRVHCRYPPTSREILTEEAFLTIGAGFNSTCGVRASDGRTICWEPELGDPGGDVFESVAVGWNHACGLRKEDRRIHCWGNNGTGEAPTVHVNR